MMEALKIKSLRQGANGMNRNAPNAANYDESKANPYPNLPDPLVLKNGEKVTTAEVWWTQAAAGDRRGLRPRGLRPGPQGRAQGDVGGDRDDRGEGRRRGGRHQEARGPRRQREVPADQGRHPAHADDAGRREGAGAGDDGVRLRRLRPAAGRARGGGRRRRCPRRRRRAAVSGGFGPPWQQLVLAKGWGYAIIVPNSIQADNGAGLTKGIIGLCNKGQPRKPDDWGSLRAWAWGASRALDYFETDKAVDAKQVGIEGLSRYGKAALVAMAYDQRFAIGFIGSSGEGGAKLHRRNFGELVENLTGSGEYHWMAGNFLKYGGPLTPGDLPVDAHELIALCAPRPIFISYGASSGPGAEGQWVDQRGSFMAAVAAGPVFRLLGKKDLGTSEFPEVETGLTDGELAFRQHKGGHTTGPNWPTFLAFADRYIKLSDAAASTSGR